MAKIFYFIEFVIICVLLLPQTLNYSGKMSTTLPNFDQVKHSVSITTPDSNADINTENFYTDDNPNPACGDSHGKLIGFPFVYKSSDNCKHGNTYDVGLWFDYALVGLVALIAVKLTSMIVNRVTRDK